MGLKLTSSCPFFFVCLFAYRMARGYEEVFNSQAGRRKGTPRETPTTSSLVAAMYVEKLRLYSQVPAEISLKMSDGLATSIVGEADNTVYFTLEQFVVGLCFPVPSLVKKFLHFTLAPPTLIHPNVFRILKGYSVLNSLYQLDISLVEICFIYTLKLGIGGRLSMSAHSPLLQFVTGILDSPKMEAKEVVLVRGPWHMTPVQGFLLI